MVVIWLYKLNVELFKDVRYIPFVVNPTRVTSARSVWKTDQSAPRCTPIKAVLYYYIFKVQQKGQSIYYGLSFKPPNLKKI